MPPTLQAMGHAIGRLVQLSFKEGCKNFNTSLADDRNSCVLLSREATGQMASLSPLHSQNPTPQKLFFMPSCLHV